MSYLGVAMILGVKFTRTFRENKMIFTPNAIKKNKDKKTRFSHWNSISIKLYRKKSRDNNASVNVACVASFSVRFRRKERGTRVNS